MEVIEIKTIKREVDRAITENKSIHANPYPVGSAAYDHFRTEYEAATAAGKEKVAA